MGGLAKNGLYFLHCVKKRKTNLPPVPQTPLPPIKRGDARVVACLAYGVPPAPPVLVYPGPTTPLKNTGGGRGSLEAGAGGRTRVCPRGAWLALGGGGEGRGAPPRSACVGEHSHRS